MVLKTLEMQGFKSFPDKTTLHFDKGITAVVGPNGSGKSNISDAVRWVLGETSTKSLRGSKMEDVIFGGTSTRKALGFAQVQLTLDNSDSALKDKDELVTVTRRYYRSGESEYKIDGESVRRKDIHELFMDTGLGADGYSMVGQGKIDSIISAKNEDRRELFEEAAGISRFRHKRTDATRRLLQAEENLIRLLDILGELENRVGPLKNQSEKAEKFLKFSEEKKDLEIGVWLQKINRFTQDLQEQEHKIDAANVSYGLCENDLTSIEVEIEKIIEDTAKINTEIEEIRSSAQLFEEDALKKDAEKSVLLTNIAHNNEMIERLKGDIETANENQLTIDERIQEREKFVEESQIKSDEKRKELEEVTAKTQELLSSNEDVQTKNVELSKNLTSLTLKLSDCKVLCSKSLSSIEEIKSRSTSVDDLINACNKEIEIIKAQKNESDKNLTFLKERIEENTNSFAGLELKLKSKTTNAEKIKSEVEKITLDYNAKSSRAKMLLDLEKNMDGFSGAVKSVMKQSSAKALSGIHGVLSQLITVSNDYSTAIEVSLGAAMQNVVTSTESDAKRAIYYLKQNNLGRATFLPISNIKGRNLDERGLDDNLGFVDIASNLVDCDSKYREIILNLLGRTVVVEDMDCAIGIAKRYNNRFKIVTLDGQVMNPGGSMSGGSRAKGAGVLSRTNQIEHLQDEANKLLEELENKKKSYSSAIEEANFAAASLQGARADLNQAQEELIRGEGDAKLIDEKLSLATSQINSLNEEKNGADKRIELLQKSADESMNETKSVEYEIEKLENELNSLTTNSKEINEKREELRQKSEAINLELVTLAKDAESAKMTAEELTSSKDNQSNRTRSILDEITSLEKRNEELSQLVEKAQEEADALRLQSNNSSVDITDKIEKRNGFEKRNSELRILEKNKNAEREKLSGELVRLDERKISMRREYDELNDNLYEQYELNRREAEALGIVIEDMQKAKARLNEIKSEIRKLGSINVGAIEEYKEVSERYEFLKEQIDDIEKSKSELSKIIDDLTVSMSEKFLTQFNKINGEFSTSFSDFFGGGKGEIILEDPANCLESQIEIKIQPPGKSVQNINLFSGGEKSLAAMALLFSVLKVTPAPFCIYDEVEAALDDVNVERFAKYMRKMTNKTQFISITHRRGTMEEADVLYGVTMQEKGVSKLLELQSAELAAKMGLED